MVSRWAESATFHRLALRGIRRALGCVGIQHDDPERLAEVGAGDDAGFDRTVHHQPLSPVCSQPPSVGDSAVSVGSLSPSIRPWLLDLAGQPERAALHAAVSLADGAGALHAGQRGV